VDITDKAREHAAEMLRVANGTSVKKKSGRKT
jgi:hypothetical protein